MRRHTRTLTEVRCLAPDPPRGLAARPPGDWPGRTRRRTPPDRSWPRSSSPPLPLCIASPCPSCRLRPWQPSLSCGSLAPPCASGRPFFSSRRPTPGCPCRSPQPPLMPALTRKGAHLSTERRPCRTVRPYEFSIQISRRSPHGQRRKASKWSWCKARRRPTATELLVIVVAGGAAPKDGCSSTLPVRKEGRRERATHAGEGRRGGADAMEGASSRRVQAGRRRKAAAGERRAMRGTWILDREEGAGCGWSSGAPRDGQFFFFLQNETFWID